MDVSLLKDLLDRERSSSSLQRVEKDLYANIGAYMKNLEKKLAEVPKESKKSFFLDYELKSAKKLSKFLFEKRMGKLINTAARMAKTEKGDLISDRDALTREEYEMLERLVEMIKCGRENILKTIDEEKAYKTVVGSKGKKKEKKMEMKGICLVRSLKDIPEFMGSNGESYIIHEEDIITLPEETAKMLIKNGLAIKLILNEGDFVEDA